MSKQQDHYLPSECEQLKICDAKHQKLKYVSSFLKLFKLIQRYDLEKCLWTCIWFHFLSCDSSILNTSKDSNSQVSQIKYDFKYSYGLARN